MRLINYSISKTLKRWLFSFLLVAFSLTMNAQYSIYSEYGDLSECSTAISGPFIIWWDKDEDFSNEAEEMLERLMSYRTECLGDLGMQDPPNAQAGAYVNIYAFTSNGFFGDNGWGCGVGTEQGGTDYRGPYLACRAATLSKSVPLSLAHETFHIFQYSSNSSGYAYSGNSGWYTEASASYYGVNKFRDDEDAYNRAHILRGLPQVPMWLGWANLSASDYPNNWQRQVHQYGMHIFLNWMTIERGVAGSIFTEGYYKNTSLLPQEYISSKLGISTFRDYFIDFAADLHNNYSFMTSEQIEESQSNWDTNVDETDVNEFVLTLDNEGTDWFRPDDDKATTSWAFNTYKLLNSKATTYSFSIKGDETGTYGDASYFQGKIIVKNTSGAVSFYDVPMSSDQDGSVSVELLATDTEVVFIIASLPSKLKDENDVFQIYSYQMQISEDDYTSCSWETIADENEVMDFTGSKTIRYGANGIYNIQTVSGGTTCANSVFGDPTPGVVKTCQECVVDNLAINGEASQSSNYSSTLGLAHLAIDGNTSGIWGENSVTHTSTEEAPWWQVELEEENAIGEIKIWNRTDCCSTRLDDFSVFVFNDAGTLVYYTTITDSPNTSISINAGGAVGSRVRIRLTETNPLSLAEVEVYTYNASSTSVKSSSSTDEITNVSTKDASDETLRSTETIANVFTLYPVPTNSELNISRTVNEETSFVGIMDLKGTILLTKDLTESYTKLDLSAFESGMYIVRFYDANGLTMDVKKIIKQ